MPRFYLFFFLLALALGAAEPSVFEAGNLNAPNPYGLTETEKSILKNKQRIEQLERTVQRQQQMMQTYNERLDGLQSLLDGLGTKQRQFTEINGSIASLQLEMVAVQQVQNESISQIKTVLQELGLMLDSINQKYVDTVRFEKLESAFLDFQSSYNSYLKKNDLSGKPNHRILSDAKEQFRKGMLDEAATAFAYLIDHHYKPATSNFYLGEIVYKQEHYQRAIAHYKKSVSLYDKSKFMPTLLLHTAISLERTGDKTQAKSFYESVTDAYPSSKEAAVAKKALSGLSKK